MADMEVENPQAVMVVELQQTGEEVRQEIVVSCKYLFQLWQTLDLFRTQRKFTE